MITYEESLSVQEYNSLRKSVHWEAIEQMQAQRLLENSAYLVVARNKDNLDVTQTIGMARMNCSEEYTVFIMDVIVRPEYQGQCIGSQLIVHILKYIKDHLESGETVRVRLMATVEKETFYKKLGFLVKSRETGGIKMYQLISK